MNINGSLHLPLSIALSIITFTGLGLIGLERNLKNITELQLRLDRCVGKTAIEYKNTLTKIEKINKKIKVARIALALSNIEPEAAMALSVYLKKLIFSQNLLITKWRAKNVLWLSNKLCKKNSDLSGPMPTLPWVRDPPDMLGQKPLRWTGKHTEVFRIWLYHKPRYSSATLEGDPNELFKANWKYFLPEKSLFTPLSNIVGQIGANIF